MNDDSNIIIVKHGNCTARVRVRNLTEDVKKRFNSVLARELMRCYHTKEAAGQHDGISTAR